MALTNGLRIGLLLLGYALITMPVNAQDVSYSFQGLVPGFSTGSLSGCISIFAPDCPSFTGTAFDFTLPQFHPALGALQSFSFSVEGFAEVDGTFTNPPLDTGGGGCGSCGNDGAAQMNYVVNGSMTAGGPSFSLAGSPSSLFLVGQIGEDGGTGGDSGFGDSFIGGPPSGLSNDDVTGTGNLNFSVFSELDLQEIDADSSSFTVDPAHLFASVDYSYTPSPTPEPSFLVATGGLLGLLGWVVWRKNMVARRS
jgi:hypothetical protein